MLESSLRVVERWVKRGCSRAVDSIGSRRDILTFTELQSQVSQPHETGFLVRGEFENIITTAKKSYTPLGLESVPQRWRQTEKLAIQPYQPRSWEMFRVIPATCRRCRARLSHFDDSRKYKVLEAKFCMTSGKIPNLRKKTKLLTCDKIGQRRRSADWRRWTLKVRWSAASSAK